MSLFMSEEQHLQKCTEKSVKTVFVCMGQGRRSSNLAGLEIDKLKFLITNMLFKKKRNTYP